MASIVVFKTSSQSSCTIQVTWTIPTLIQLFTTRQEIILSNPDARGLLFKIKPFKSPETGAQFMVITYLYPSSIVCDIELLVCYNNMDNNSLRTYDRNNRFYGFSDVVSNYKTLELKDPNKWHLLGSITENDIRYRYVCDDGCTRLRFTITLYHEVKCNKPKVPAPQLGIDLENMLLNGPYSDIVMKSVDGQEFNVHKNMLASRCAVLKALFEHNSIESQNNFIESPFTSDVLKEVLSFIYTDKADVKKSPQELLQAADYYDLKRLKSLSEEVLISKLSIENIIDILQLAELHSAEDLKKSSFNFIKKTGLKQIIKTESWTKLDPMIEKRIIYEYLE